ncbi:L-threonylcarbamoyladenylate synthase [Rhodohalobacter sp. 614A]|uniref:L-threonylcarbamoyladenylate synthase n=1 Tax=Rhodohalobacter sp. 614A TaxID=2908649 RepID=UPI001F2FB348|nr:L-threonylcarbamoyladenylate synthase [Rhodohalobacter sp. 614A]
MKVTLEKATDLIKKGHTVAIPTETVYGLAADAFNVNAVKKIFEQKGRPSENPLIVHISDFDQLDLLASEIPETVKKLADQFWPGPLSIVLKKKDSVPDIVTGGLDTVAIRMPDHPLTLSLIKKTVPLTAPSANKSGRPSPTNIRHIEEDFGPELPVLDGDSSKIGLESTVVDLSGEKITVLRPGFVDARMIEDVLCQKVWVADQSDESTQKKSPGTRFTHYKPRADVQWLVEPILKITDSNHYYLFHRQRQQSSQKNVHSYDEDYPSLARDLYDHFRTADHLSCSTIFIEPFESEISHPIIPALKDRIEKAISS